jgi:tRNA dimethylallyltransferase
MATPHGLICVLGPTASGKTRLAVALAKQLNGEIISADSRQIFKGMDIGTGKDLSEYQGVKHHLIDILDAGQTYNVHQFQQDFSLALHDIVARQKVPILCGGTGLYMEAVLQNFEFTGIPIDATLREQLAQKTIEELLQIFQDNASIYSSKADVSTHKRLIRAIEIAIFLNQNPDFIPPQKNNQSFDYQIFGIEIPVETRRERISTRLHTRLRMGMIAEVEYLLSSGVSVDQLIFYGLEYKWITEYLTNQIDYPTMVARLEVAIHQFAKRQMTFFRKMEKDGLKIHWVDGLLPLEKQVETIISHVSQVPSQMPYPEA